MYIGLRVECRLLLSDLNEIRSFSADFFEKYSRYQILRKSVRWEGELFHADGQT